MKTIKERIPALLVVMGLILYTTLMIIICGIGYSNRYEDELYKLGIENKKLEYRNKELMASLDALQTQLNNAYDIECDCGVKEYEKGYIIDGYYYELKEQVGEE